MSTQLRCQDDHIWALQAEICNRKVAHETQNNNVKGNKKGGQPYKPEKKRNPSDQMIQRRKNIAAKITGGTMVMIQATHTHRRKAQE